MLHLSALLRFLLLAGSQPIPAFTLQQGALHRPALVDCLLDTSHAVTAFFTTHILAMSGAAWQTKVE
jgi:hypothetical protein